MKSVDNHDWIDVHVHDEILQLTCGVTAFERLRDKILTDVQVPMDEMSGGIWLIEIEAAPSQKASRKTWRDWFVKIGCGGAVVIMTGVFVVGIVTISRWAFGY
jgi:hypothetical protein